MGERLRTLRKARRLTLKAVAGSAGIGEGCLNQTERGRANPSIATLQQISAALGLEVADLFGDDFTSGPSVLRADEAPPLALGVLGMSLRWLRWLATERRTYSDGSGTARRGGAGWPRAGRRRRLPRKGAVARQSSTDTSLRPDDEDAFRRRSGRSRSVHGSRSSSAARSARAPFGCRSSPGCGRRRRAGSASRCAVPCGPCRDGRWQQ
ncbi:helix-turn-helix domain-containing protein [Streptomyces sp. NA02950]|uniref:helix-turn-helix domain-containing protein n=1 Tax=Streptomyces sp. NA02950 TaxID=2742137 RepID=UPI0034CE47D5